MPGSDSQTYENRYLSCRKRFHEKVRIGGWRPAYRLAICPLTLVAGLVIVCCYFGDRLFPSLLIV